VKALPELLQQVNGAVALQPRSRSHDARCLGQVERRGIGVDDLDEDRVGLVPDFDEELGCVEILRRTDEVRSRRNRTRAGKQRGDERPRGLVLLDQPAIEPD